MGFQAVYNPVAWPFFFLNSLLPTSSMDVLAFVLYLLWAFTVSKFPRTILTLIRHYSLRSCQDAKPFITRQFSPS